MLKHVGYLLSRFVGWYNQSFFFSHPVAAVACAADGYTPAPAHNPNGELVENRVHLGLVVADVTVGEEEEADERPLAIVAGSQFLYPGVRLLGRYMGDATVGEGEEADTREVYQVATCGACLWGADYFERPNNEEPGDTWQEESGDADIDTGRLVTTDPDARFWFWRGFPDHGGIFFYQGDVTVKLSATEAGAQAVVLAARDPADPDKYALLIWEFGADDGKLLVRYTGDGSTEATPIFYFTLAGSEIIFAGQGVAHESTIRVCWNVNGINLYVHRHDGRIWPGHIWTGGVFVGGGLLINGPGHGVGTRDVPGGLVRFDDYEARLGNLENLVGGPATNDQRDCPTCHRCHGCPDDQQLCLKVDQDVWILTRRGAATTDHDDRSCGWQSEQFDDLEGVGWQWLVHFYLQDNGHWILWLVESRFNGFVLTVRRVFGYVLGTDAPHCDDWHCLPLRDASAYGFAGILPQGLDDHSFLPIADASLSSGDDCAYCYGYDEADCCEETEMPETLHMVVYVEDVPASAELTMTYTETPDGWEYNTEFGGGILCTREPLFGVPGTGAWWCCIPGETGDDAWIPLTINSCEPFSATGCKIAALDGREWCVEVYE